MKKQKFFTLLLLSVMMLALVALVSCSGDRGNKGDLKTDDGKKLTEKELAKDDSASLAQSMTVGIPQDLDSLDPHKAEAAGTREVLFNIYEGLLKIEPNGDLKNAIAEKHEISEDGLIYTFTLRENVKFHNDKPVSAEDVKYSIEHCAGKNGEALLVPSFKVIDSVEIKDEKTIEIKLTKPDAEIVYSFTNAIVPQLEAGQKFEPIGTGPFKFVSWTPQESVIIKKFNDYWGEPAFLDDVKFLIIEDSNLIATELKSGAVDMFCRVAQDQANQVSDVCNILEGNMNLVQALYLNNTVKPLDDIRVRQALAYGTNKKEILELVSYDKGKLVGSSMIAGFSRYYMPELENAYPYDVEKAKALLADAGYPNGFDLEIAVPANYKYHVDTAQVIAEQLKNIGVNVKIKPIEWSAWLSDVYNNREYQSTVIGVDARTMSADSFLNRFYSTSKKNFNNFSDEQYDKNYELAKNTIDIDEQAKYYKECLKILSDRAANVYIQDIVNLVAINKNYEGYQFYPLYILDMAKIKRIK